MKKKKKAAAMQQRVETGSPFEEIQPSVTLLRQISVLADHDQAELNNLTTRKYEDVIQHGPAFPHLCTNLQRSPKHLILSKAKIL